MMPMTYKTYSLKLICLMTAFLSFAAGHVCAQDTRMQEEKKARLEREIAIIDRQLSENSSRSSAMLSNLTLVRKKIANRKELVSDSDRQIRKYTDDIYLTQLKINRMKARVDTLSAHYSRLVVSAYKHRDARVWYMYMLSSDNLGQAFRRLSYFKSLSDRLNEEARQLKLAQEELELEREKLSQMKAEAETVKKERVKELDRLKKEEAEADKVVRQLRKNRKTYQNQLSAKRKEVEALNREIAKIVAQAMKGQEGSASGGSGKRKTEVDTKLAAEFAANRGKLPWPADGPVVEHFGKHFHPVYKNLELPPNNGIDIALSPGTSVNAVFDGVVKQIIVMPGYNQCILIQHGNYFTFYCKLKSTDVKAGDKVKTGQKIGKVDTINGNTWHHFEVWQGTVPQNPEKWLK